jgi:hypothetical protein
MPTKYFSKKKQCWMNYYKPKFGPKPLKKNPRATLRNEIGEILFTMSMENLKTILALVKTMPHDEPKLGRKRISKPGEQIKEPKEQIEEPPKSEGQSVEASAEGQSVEASVK